MDTSHLWAFILWGYGLTVLTEAPILYAGLSRVHTRAQRMFAGVWLTACTYPIVVLVMPIWLNMAEQRWLYLTVAEIFAPLAECILFWAAFQRGRDLPRSQRWRDYAVITIANLISFILGEILYANGLFSA